VESPHQKGLLACSRHWRAAHGEHPILVPSELRESIEEDLGIAELAPNPPGTGPTEDRPRGNARESGTLTATRFTPARAPRTSAEGYVLCDEALSWARMTELMDRITAQLSLTTINADMRTLLERGRLVLSRLSRDGAALPTDPMGLRWKPTFYARRLTLGRLTAGASSTCSRCPTSYTPVALPWHPTRHRLRECAPNHHARPRNDAAPQLVAP